MKIKKNLKKIQFNKKRKRTGIHCLNKTIYSNYTNFIIPNFLDIQRLSFQLFLKQGLLHELKKLKTITNSNKTFQIFFYASKYKFISPKSTAKQAILKGKTYSAPLLIPVKCAIRSWSIHNPS